MKVGLLELSDDCKTLIECDRSATDAITIPNCVTEIGDSAFRGCNRLTAIEIPDSVTNIGDSTFIGCTRLTAIEIPNSVTKIGYSAFYGCTGLTAIEIPDSVTKIGVCAFDDCTGLTAIHIRHEHPEKIQVHENAFDKIACFCTLYVPVGTGYSYRHHPVFGKFKEVIIEK